MQRITARWLRPSVSFATRRCVGAANQVSVRAEPRQSENHRRANIAPIFEADVASVCSVAAVVTLAGVGAFFVRSKKVGQPDSAAELQLEHVDAGDLQELRRTASAVTFRYVGSDAKLRGACFRIRIDDSHAISADAAGALLLATGFSQSSELVVLDAGVAAELLAKCGSQSAPADGCKTRVPALKIATAAPPSEAISGSIVTLQLQPGSGLADLYGNAFAFTLQADSEMRRDELGRAGGYNARDIFSGRPDHVIRALHALAEKPKDILSISIEDNRVFPRDPPEGAAGPKPHPRLCTDALREALGLEGGVETLMEVFAGCLDREGKPLLIALLRAQCSAGAIVTEQAQQLDEVLRQRAGLVEDGSLISREAFEASFKRGFWTLPADESGKTAREREGERLLERARRELWADGSASRRELEAQVRTFLSRNLLGRAANNARIQLSVVRARPERANLLRELRFVPSSVPGGPGIDLWCRLDLLDLEVPPERMLRA